MLSENSKGVALWVKNLSKAYAAKVLENVSFRIERGESVGLVGPNGAGKSTLIKIILGLVHSDDGMGEVFDLPLAQVSGHSKVSYLPELPGFWPEVSAYEYLNFSRRIQPFEASLPTVEHFLSMVGLKERGRRPMGTYSKGMVQRTGIAWAMQRNPEMYILDEPMSGLDPRAQAMVRNALLAEKAKGCTMLISSHSFEDIRVLCDRVLVLNRHGVEFDGDPETALSKIKQDILGNNGWDNDYD